MRKLKKKFFILCLQFLFTGKEVTMKGGYKYVKIPTDIFYKIARFLVTMDEGLHEEICEYYQCKLGKMHNHNLYSTFKTSENQEEMEDARIEYLDRKGIHEDFRY